ncbi:Rossmann-fold NAD(P)-binding domain-containing protein [Klebsiella quasipneumoniae]|uniref:hypothetical protein n=1 Tax=Klebsiella quasipneumoniae TaxID=1463165 RepID=UPI00389067C3
MIVNNAGIAQSAGSRTFCRKRWIASSRSTSRACSGESAAATKFKARKQKGKIINASSIAGQTVLRCWASIRRPNSRSGR